MSDIIKVILVVAFIVAVVAIGPLLTIWALNTLFPVLAIPFSLSTWAAVVLLGSFLNAKFSVKK